MNKLIVSLFILLIFSCNKFNQDYTEFVDPFIGSDDHGHVFVGATTPFGGVQVGPSNFHKGWDWTSSYHYTDSIIKGFGHLYLSGTGIGDLGEILLMPTTNNDHIKPGFNDYEKGYASKYLKKNEYVKPGYYRVKLERYNIDVELTASKRSGFHKYTFPKSNNSRIIINLKEGNGWDISTETFLEKVNDTIFQGYRYSKGWAKNQKEYFSVVFSKPADSFYIIEKDKKFTTNRKKGSGVIGFVNFKTNDKEIVYAKVGISPVSIKNAHENLLAEIKHWDFNKIKNSAKKSWNDELSKIKIETNDISKKRIFYTALYHTMVTPNLYHDVNGEYRGADDKIYKDNSFSNYTLFSLWDTYRAAHPLYTITHPEKVSDFINSMIKIYEHQGKLPVWHLRANETNTMPGYSAVPVLVDASLKGFNLDLKKIYEAVKITATKNFEPGVKELMEIGYIPADFMVESVASNMEYAISDWGIAQLAKKLSKPEDYEYFKKRSKAYREYFDPETGFMRGKLSDGSWRTPFDPISAEHRVNDYCEGNAWQYLWLVPHDPEGLIELLGGDKAFNKKLDELFSMSSELGEEASMDISGLIGQYAHGNEPSHHTAYMYAYSGEHFKIADKVRYINNELYTDKPDGLSGNEDCGQMSAWYVFSSLGFYPVNPSNGAYVFGSPLFDEVLLDVPGQNKFKISAKNNSDKNIYIQSVSLNGKDYKYSYITHKQILDGGELKFIMGPNPNKNFGKEKKYRPKSIIY